MMHNRHHPKPRKYYLEPCQIGIFSWKIYPFGIAESDIRQWTSVQHVRDKFNGSLVVIGRKKPKDTAIQELLDKHEIQEILMRYCRSVDRMDWETVRSCYHPDAIDDHGLYSGPVDGFIKFFSDWAGQQYQCAMHLIGNVLVELKGDQAVSESYSITHLRLSKERAFHSDFRKLWDSETKTGNFDDEATAIDVTLGLRMIDRFERRTDEGPWLISHRVIVHEWSRLDPVHFQLNAGGTIHQGRRDQTDLIFERLADLQHDSNSG